MNDKRSLLLGNFDGLHIGHRYLIDEFIKSSNDLELNPSVMTYAEHPLKFINPTLENYYIDSDEIRVERLSKTVSTIIVNFKEFQNLTALEFFSYIKSHYKDTQTIFMGHDTSFGKDKVSEVNVLESYKLGFKFIKIPKFTEMDVSSTLIRDRIKSADLKGFESLTNRKFTICSKVIPGKQIGRTIGFPTANLLVDMSMLRLPNGVYMGEVMLDGRSFNFVANIGLRPTLDDDEAISIEAHILDFDQDIYGRELKLEVLAKVRDIKKFNSKEELSTQIQKDISDAKAFFNR